MRRGDMRGPRYERAGVCDKGHPYGDAYVFADGGKQCRTCVLERQARERRDPANPRHRLNHKPNAKFRHLTRAQMDEIKALRAAGVPSKEVAARFNCHPGTVSAVANGHRDNAKTPVS